ncbi:MAG: Trm112 family protein [Mariprofundaceae bacterium]
MIDQALLDILACPKCKSKVQYNPSKSALTCQQCEVQYPIRDDIPVMLVDEACPISD